MDVYSHLFPNGNRKWLPGGEVENAPVPETIGHHLVSPIQSQSLTEESEPGEMQGHARTIGLPHLSTAPCASFIEHSAEEGPTLRPIHPYAGMVTARRLEERLSEQERLLE